MDTNTPRVLSQLPEPPFVLIQGGNIFAPELIGKQDILMAAGRILKIAPSIKFASDLGEVKIVNAAGMRVVPGLIDGHVHILGGGGQSGGHTRNRDLLLTQATLAGVTTMVGCLGTDYYTRHVSSLLAKARGLEAEGLSTYIVTGGYGVPTPTITQGVLSDLVLIDKVIGVGEIAMSDFRSSQPTHEELARLAADAHIGGLYGQKAGIVIFHVGEGKKGLAPLRQLVEETDLPMKQFVPTHINRTRSLWEEAIAYAQSGGFIDITAGISPARGFPRALKPSDAVAEALKKGIPIERITMSSDANGNMPVLDSEGHLSNLLVQTVSDLTDEIRDLVQVNQVPLETALGPVTTSAARMLRLDRKGRLQPNYDGDALVLTDDFKVQALVSRGRVLVENAKPVVKGYFE